MRFIASTAHPDVLEVVDRGHAISFSFADVMRYHGFGSPGGVALGFRAVQRGLPLLGSTCERRKIDVQTAFPGPGARDAFECALRAVTEDRYRVDPALERTELAPTRARFVFRLACGGRAVTLTLREGFVVPEFLDLLGKERDATQAARLEELKGELADRLMAAAPGAVYDASVDT